MALLTHLPNELLFEITRYLDVISIIRLTCVSSALHHKIGLSKSFWLRYCHLLLKDERLPASSFPIETLEVSGLIKLATRTERLARASHASQWPGPMPAHRTQFSLGHDPELRFQRQSIHATPDLRWIMGLAQHKSDNTLRVLCWDVDPPSTNSDIQATVPPVASIEISAGPAEGQNPRLWPPWYDPESQSYYSLITWIPRGYHESTFAVLLIKMACKENHRPSLHAPNELINWPRDARTKLEHSGRWAVIHHFWSQSVADVWDLQKGEATSYPVTPHTGISFETLIVTHCGNVFRIRGEEDEHHLFIQLSRISDDPNLPLNRSESFETSGTALPSRRPANFCVYAVIPHGVMRLAEGNMVTVTQIQCVTANYRFSTTVTISEDGILRGVPSHHEPWRLNEHMVPIWASQPESPFAITSSAESSSSTIVNADLQELFLFIMPHARYGPEQGVGHGLLAVPRLASDIGVQTYMWSCGGACLRSGSWMFMRSGQDSAWVITIIRSD
ncbi:hypothetical protein DL93DRAFT_722664 [Clavulina sp. PMI_390]|nr:hypothetical protein DL93DRAFT_722664 [Clavulina sp. PMI_390]